MTDTVETPKDLWDDLSKRIKNLASKMDVILFGVEKNTEKYRKELTEDVFTLQCFHLGVYGQPNTILDRFLKRIDEKQSQAQKKQKKDSGSYFTPPFIAEYIVRSAIGPLIEKIEADTEVTDKIARILDLRICDPCVGGGIFLACAHDFVMTEIMRIKPDTDLDAMSHAVGTKCLFGVDINPEAVDGCKLILNLNIAKWSLKKKIEEFASTVSENSASPNAKCGSSEKPPSAHAPALDGTSTPKTTRTKGKRKRVKNAANLSESPIGTEPSDSVPSDALQTADFQDPDAT